MVEIRATVALKVEQVKRQPTKAEQALIYSLSQVSFSWLKAQPVTSGRSGVGMCMQARAHQDSNAPAAAHAVCATEVVLQGYRITQVSSLFPFFHFYSAKQPGI